MILEPVIGLEIHIQLKTKTKMFCSCPTHDSAVSPNQNICPICMGHPGTLPVPNKEAVRFGLLMGHALSCSLAPSTKFDRKNYFYPDLPKGYQISQFDVPIAYEGHLDLSIPTGARKKPRIGITRVHLEEDSAKSFHGEEGRTFVDYNRGGTPLIEIVTEPDFKTPQEAKVFLQELRQVARYLDISSADMEKGHLRCDVNISLREIDKDGNLLGPKFNPKSEVKNVNSFRHVERVLEHEIKRQSKLWETGDQPKRDTTRGWDDTKQVTVEQRIKESSSDYRYFPEPDIPPLDLTEMIEDIKRKLPELPAKRRTRFVEEYGFKHADAKQICEDPALADYVEHTFSELQAWLQSQPDISPEDLESYRSKMAKLVSGWLLSKLAGLMAERSIDIRIIKISPENFAEFITLIALKKLNTANGLQVLTRMLEDGSDPSHVMEEEQLGTMEDLDELAEAVQTVLDQNPAEVLRYKEGETQLIKLFIGLVMRATEGNADPGATKNILLVKLK
jgi:aspartyl-tRNA(Asn)/glutamyl-tRNA(Gln) amidotransferase subunit B